MARVFSTLPGQLAKHDKKFRLASLDANARGRDYVVAQQLTCDGRGLYFYPKRDDGDRSSTMEIDFLITAGYDDAAGRLRVLPVEVKSTKRYSTRSLDKFRDKFGGRVGTRCVLHPRPLVIYGDDLVRLPLYASMPLASGHKAH